MHRDFREYVASHKSAQNVVPILFHFCSIVCSTNFCQINPNLTPTIAPTNRLSWTTDVTIYG
jgi:hypothetical protein